MNWMIRYGHITTSIVNVAFFVGELANLPDSRMLPSSLAGLSSTAYVFGQSLEFGKVKV